MPAWLQGLLGVSGDEIPAGADVRLMWTRFPQSWRVFLMLFAIIAVVMLVIRLYQRDASRLSLGRRRLLAGLRLAALTLVGMTALGPALQYTHQRILQPTVVVLRDASQSMATADRYSSPAQTAAIAKGLGRSEGSLGSKPPTRAEIVNELFERENRSLLRALQEKGRLRLMDFAEAVRSVEIRSEPIDEESKDKHVTGTDSDKEGPVAAWPSLIPIGPGTNLHRALSEALAERQAAAILLATDGQHTDRGTGRDDLLSLAEQARQKGVPLMIVGLGDPNRPRNVSVSDVHADARVWKDDSFELQGSIRSDGFGGESLRVELVELEYDTSSDGTAGGDVSTKITNEIVVETRDVPLPAEGGTVRLTFSHTPKRTGRYGYLLRVPPQTGESTVEDNQSTASAQVKVIDDKARLLLVAGAAHWDYRFVRQILEREKSIEVSCWLQSLDESRSQEGNKTITHLPRTREELFEYDVVLLLDPDPREFDEAWLKLLVDFVGEHAGGLLYMAGPAHSTRFVTGVRTGEIRTLLPVRFGDVAATDVTSLLESNDREWQFSFVDAGLDHPVMRFHPDQQRSLDIWKLLPGINWSFPTREAAPAASTLLQHSDPALMQVARPRPLLVSGQYGGGRTLFMGFDGTWRWRSVGRNAEFFNRFWLQSVRYLIEGRSVEGKRRGTLETDRSRYEVGDRIGLVARLSDSTFQSLSLPEVTAKLVTPGRDPVPIVLRAVPQQPGRYEAAVTAQHVGRHTIRVDLNEATASGAPVIESNFAVSPPSLETERTWLDEGLLKELAAKSGGHYLTVDRMGELASLIPDKRQTLLIRGKPIPLWDTNRVLLLLVGLLCTEWALRKHFKLL